MVSEKDKVRVKAEFSAFDEVKEYEGVVREVCDDGSLVVETEDESVTEVFTTGSTPVSQDDIVEILD